jgi:predicted SnoaL-like aldol condensation-catalyzing enzyme
MTPLEVITAYGTAMRAGDWNAGIGFFADDVVGYVPGRSDLAGVKRGKAALVEYLDTVISHVRDRVELVIMDTLVGAEYVGLLVREILGEGDDRIEIRRLNVYKIVDDKIVEIRIFEADQYAVDEWTAGLGH